jgi:hypothetical protein
MAEDETLRLAVQITDQFSVPIRDLQRQVGAMADQLRKTHKLGIGDADAHFKAFRKLREETHELSTQVKSVVTPAMAAFGITTLSVAGAVAAITKSVGDFGTVARNLSNLSHFSGLRVQDVRVYEELAAALGSSKTEMDGFITSFSTNMDQWRRLGRGPVAEFFATQGSQIRNLGIALRHSADNAQALNLVFDFLADNRYTDVQKKILTDAIGMPAAFAHAGAGARELMAKLNAEVKPLDKGWEERKQRYLESMALLSASWSNLSLHIGDTTSTLFADMANDVRKFVDNNGPEIEKFARDAVQWLESVDWQKSFKGAEEVAHDLSGLASSINSLVTSTTGWKPVLEFLLVYKAANILGLTSAVRGLASSFGLLSAVTLPAWMVALMAGGGAYRLATAPGESLGVTGPRSVLGNVKELWGMATGAKPPEPAPGPVAAPAPGATDVAPVPAEPPKQSWSDWLKSWQGSLTHKESFAGYESEGPNPLRAAQSALRFPAEETLGGTAGGSTSDAINTIAIGTRRGVYDGMVDYYQYLRGMSGAGETGGFTRASYGLGGQGTAPAGTGRAGGLGGTGEGGGEEGPGQYPTSLDELRSAVAGKPSKGDPRGMLGAVRQAAIRNGINPDLMERVAKGEGLAGYVGDSGTSFGSMQLHRGGPGSVGYEYEKATGHSLTDRRFEPEQIEFAAKWIRKHGWGAWTAARNQGITGKTGVGIDTSRWSKELEPGKAPHLTLDDIRKRIAGAGSIGDQIKQSLGLGGAETAVGGGPPKAFIMHHTGGRGTVEGVQNTLRQRGLGVEYVMDRDGNIVHTGGPGSANIMPGWGPKGAGLNNANIVGMEIIAKNDRDVTKAQITAAAAFIKKNYPNTPVYGHGEVNPGHKEADEGLTVANAIRQQREAEAARSQQSAALHGAELRRHFGHPTSEWQQRIKKAISGGGLNEWNSSWIRGPQGTIPGRELTEGIKGFDQKRNDQDLEFLRHQHQLRGQQASLGDLSPGDLIKSAQRVGMAGTMQHTVTGRAGVDINLSGFPRGTTARSSSSGIFNEVKLDRGRVPRADTEA